MTVRRALASVDDVAERALRRTGRLVFGDRTGLTVFLGALALYAFYWRVDVFIVDTFAVANALVALEGGHLAIRTVEFGPTGAEMPGLYVADGTLYGRNYGHAFLSLPVLLVLRGLSLLVAPRILLAGGWSLLVLAFALQVGRVAGRRQTCAFAGSAVALGAFAGNVLLATNLPRRMLPLVALQLTTMVAAALLGVVAYRLVASRYGYRSAVFAGIATVLLGPVGFWASIPKRHVLTALFALLALYWFARSRDAADRHRELRTRALMYATVGLTAWVSAPEGLVLLAALGPTDLLTARTTDGRSLAVVGGALLVGLLPFFLTNAAISGDPLLPPRMLPSAGTAQVAASTGDAGASAATAGGSGESASAAERGTSTPSGSAREARAGVGTLVASLAAGAQAALARFGQQVSQGIGALDPSRLYHVFVRSGRIPGVDYSMTGGQTVDLALLESAPLLAALVALPAAGVADWGRKSTRCVLGGDALARFRQRLRDPETATDTFAMAYALLLALVYLPRLPLHSTITVRYLVPAVPFALYGVARLRAVRTAVEERARTLAVTAGSLTVVGAVTGTALFGATDFGVGAVVQLTAVANLAVAGLVAAWSVAATRRAVRPAVGGVVLGVALATMAAFLLLSGVEYFGHGREFALGVTRALEQTLPIR